MPDLPASLYVPVFGALCAVIIYQNKVTIPAIVGELRAANAGYLDFAKSAAPILDKATDLIEKCRESYPFNDRKKAADHA